ncbi:hypothetical protein L1987_25049 [Smallanthus sonchifolius]|uniref:Uncharacterized protein n=1 Tax=Smallanthus sonchifolius TaxID=185202 RepID=A0ACB9INK1_9ASTR|nr:hypothetical protein L1987_25049 [Smallanthus sonchifolius]
MHTFWLGAFSNPSPIPRVYSLICRLQNHRFPNLPNCNLKSKSQITIPNWVESQIEITGSIEIDDGRYPIKLQTFIAG